MTGRTIGDVQRFALAFELVDDPDAGGSPARRASWGRLRIWVGGRNLTLGCTVTGTTTDAAMVPLLPIVEWLADQWDPLLHEERLPRPRRSLSAASWHVDVLAGLPREPAEMDALLGARERWWTRHGLGAALPDFRLPDLHIRRYGARVELSWDDREWRTVPTGVVLAERPGRALLPAAEVAEVLFDWSLAVVDAVEARAAGNAPVQALLLALRGRFEAHAREDRREARLRWMAGVDLTKAARRLRDLAGVAGGAVEDTVRALLGLTGPADPGLVARPTIPALLFRSVSPRLSADDLDILIRLAHASPGATTDALRDLQSPEAPPADLDAITADGLDRALELRAALGIPEAVPLTGEQDLEAVQLRRLGVAVEDIHLDDTGVDGVAIASPDRAPTIAVNRSGRFARTPWGRRMTLAHELCHILHDIEEDGRVAVVSNPWADPATERRANAFAVMLLAPEKAIEAVLARDPEAWTPGALREAMRRLGVGLTTLTWQLRNLGWIDDSERQAWMDELSGG